MILRSSEKAKICMLDLLMTIYSSGGIKSVVSNLDKVQFARFYSEVETSNKQLFTKRFTLEKGL